MTKPAEDDDPELLRLHLRDAQAEIHRLREQLAVVTERDRDELRDHYKSLRRAMGTW